MDEEKQYKKMTETPVSKLVLTLAVPTIISMLITSIYNLADTFFVGRISTSASGAVGIVSSLMAIIQALGFTLGHGSGSLISRSLGRHDTESAVRFASTAFFTALAAGLVLSVSGLSFLEPFMNLLGSTPTILPHAKGYAMYILMAAPIMISSFVMNNILRYEGKAFYAMIALVSGGLLNMALDPLLIFTFEMGTAGAGAATAISQCVSFTLLLSPFLRKKTTSHFSIRKYTRSIGEFGRILATGFPSFGRQGLASIAVMLLNIAAKQWGDPAVAAMSIVGRVFMLLLCASLGIGQGFQPVAAFNYGAKKFRRVKKAAQFTMAVGFVCATIVTVSCFIAAEPLIKLFRDDPEVFRIAIPAFRYQAAAMLAQPIMVTANMLFQSIGKSGKASFLSMCRQGVYFIPLILILPKTIGLLGVEICQPVADVLTFATSLPFLVSFLRHLEKMQREEDEKQEQKSA